ncbi:MAG TPA: DUF4836 family protein [Panacibacter sp.]|nr:DUF4836 family protein [Panacibacter sp.]HNP42678.1 DUF4836 family protein [Panacibacter sp.]
MKKLLRYTLLFAAILLFATSCKKSVPDQVKYIPKDAMFILDLDWKSLSDKAAKGNINWDSLFKSANVTSDTEFAFVKGKIDEFMKSGIDESANVFLFIKTGGSIMTGQSTSAGAVVAMKDAGMFESYIKKQPGIGEVKKGSDYSYVALQGDLFVGWNKDVAILTSADMNTGQDGSEAPDPKKSLDALFGLKEETSVASIPEFVDLLAEKGDMLFFSNSTGALNTLPLLGMTKFADLLKDSYGAGVINFEDGKVNANFKSYSGKDLADIWKKYAGPTVDMGMVSQYPLPVEGYAAFSFNPQIITEMIKYGGFESTVNDFVSKEGFTTDDIVKAFKGDFAIIFSDIAVTEKETEYEGIKFKSKQPTAKLLFNAKIGDKVAFDKIMKKLVEEGLLTEKNGQYVPAGDSFGYSLNIDSKNLVIANDSTLLQQYLAGKGNAAIPAAVADKSKGKSFAFYVDINKILQAMPEDSSARAAVDAAKAAFKDATATAENFNGKFVGSSMELATMQPSENSFVTLVKFFSSVARQIQREEERLQNRGMVDMDQEMDSDRVEPAPPAEESAK